MMFFRSFFLCNVLWLGAVCGLLRPGAARAEAVPAAETQRHGFLFEEWVRGTFFDGYQPKSYTQRWDIPAAANRKHGRIPVNPKAAKFGGPVDLGDALRQYDIAQGREKFLLIVGFWEQKTPEQKHFVNAQAVVVTPEKYRQLWGGITRADLERLDAVVKDRSLSLAEARRRAQEIKKQPPFSEALITINPKIDRSQRRVQCSLRPDVFFRILAPGQSAEKQAQPRLFGVPLPQALASAPRRFPATRQTRQ